MDEVKCIWNKVIFSNNSLEISYFLLWHLRMMLSTGRFTFLATDSKLEKCSTKVEGLKILFFFPSKMSSLQKSTFFHRVKFSLVTEAITFCVCQKCFFWSSFIHLLSHPAILLILTFCWYFYEISNKNWYKKYMSTLM